MNKKTFFVAISAAVLLSASYIGYRQVSNSQESDLFMANVEALSDCEHGKLQCTRGVTGSNCMKQGRHGEEFVCAIFTSVEDYEVCIGSPILCKHDAVGRCPSGTEEQPWGDND